MPIRSFQDGDLSAILALWRDEIADASSCFYRPGQAPQNEVAEAWFRRSAIARRVAVSAGDVVVGFAQARLDGGVPSVMLLVSKSLASNARTQTGKALLAAIVEELANLGYSQVSATVQANARFGAMMAQAAGGSSQPGKRVIGGEEVDVNRYTASVSAAAAALAGA